MITQRLKHSTAGVILVLLSLMACGQEPETGVELLLELNAGQVKGDMNRAVHQVEGILARRLKTAGFGEATVSILEDGRIRVNIPGKVKPDFFKYLTVQGFLEFKLVEGSRNADLLAIDESSSPDLEVVYKLENDPETGRETAIPYVLRKRALMTGETIAEAEVVIDSLFNRPYISVEFDSKGARQFANITKANVGKRLAIVLDGAVQSAPVIQEEIGGGKAQITGNFSQEEANGLVAALESGALPAPLTILQVREWNPNGQK